VEVVDITPLEYEWADGRVHCVETEHEVGAHVGVVAVVGPLRYGALGHTADDSQSEFLSCGVREALMSIKEVMVAERSELR